MALPKYLREIEIKKIVKLQKEKNETKKSNS